MYSAKKTMWFIRVEVEQETIAPPPKKNPGSAPVLVIDRDPCCNAHRVEEEIHIRVHSHNINGDSRIESPEA